jgi:hypothetical protein
VRVSYHFYKDNGQDVLVGWRDARGSCEEIIYGRRIESIGCDVKMELSFRLFLQFAFDDPGAVLEKMVFHQSKTFIPNAGGLPIAGVQSIQIRFRCPEEHFLATKRENFLLSFLDWMVCL